MKVAILMPVYNTHKVLLAVSLRSLLAQTHEDIVICVHQDGGNDISWVSDLDGRIVFTRTEENRGLGMARQYMLDNMVDCDMFTWVDSDDGLMPKAVGYAVQAAKKISVQEFWYVRLKQHMIIRMNQDKSFAMARVLEDAIFRGDFTGFTKRALHGPYLSVYGPAVGLYLPRELRSLAVFTDVVWGMDEKWTQMLLVRAKEKYGKDASKFGVAVEQPLDGMYIRLAPLSDSEKYRPSMENSVQS